MRRVDHDTFMARRSDPSTGSTAAGENQRMQIISLNDSKFKVAVIRGG